jgi:hypothetical protein
MMFLLEVSLILTLSSGLVLWFYWSVLFPCLALKSRFQIQQITDETYLAVRDGTISSASHGFIELEYFLVISRRMARQYEIIGSPRRRKPQAHELEQMQKRFDVIHKDVPQIRDAFKNLTRWMVALYLASNPIELLEIGFLMVGAFFSDRASRRTEREEKEVYAIAAGLPA